MEGLDVSDNGGFKASAFWGQCLWEASVNWWSIYNFIEDTFNLQERRRGSWLAFESLQENAPPTEGEEKQKNLCRESENMGGKRK